MNEQGVFIIQVQAKRIGMKMEKAHAYVQCVECTETLDERNEAFGGGCLS